MASGGSGLNPTLNPHPFVENALRPEQVLEELPSKDQVDSSKHEDNKQKGNNNYIIYILYIYIYIYIFIFLSKRVQVLFLGSIAGLFAI